MNGGRRESSGSCVTPYSAVQEQALAEQAQVREALRVAEASREAAQERVRNVALRAWEEKRKQWEKERALAVAADDALRSAEEAEAAEKAASYESPWWTGPASQVPYQDQRKYRDWQEQRRKFVAAAPASDAALFAYAAMLDAVTADVPPLASDIVRAQEREARERREQQEADQRADDARLLRVDRKHFWVDQRLTLPSGRLICGVAELEEEQREARQRRRGAVRSAWLRHVRPTPAAGWVALWLLLVVFFVVTAVV